MPLRLWLPLDGTNENRGIAGTVMQGSPNSWGNGRTGKCAVFNDNVNDCIYNNTTEFNYTVEDFSWCMWLKRDQSAMTATAMFAFSVGRPDYGDNRGYGLAVHTANTLRFWFGYSNYDVTGFPNNEWHHVAFTRKGNTLKMYMDGILKSTKTYTGALPTYHTSYGPGIGCFHYSSNIYPLIGAISDFRIYDHTLSDREVYQISRALLVHFPLTAPDNALPNLLAWTNNYTEATPYVHTSSATDGYKYMGNDSLITVTPGKVYYVQLKCDHTPKASHGATGSVCDQFTFWFYIRNIGTSKGIGSYDQIYCFTSTNIFINDPENNLYVWKWTAPSNAQDITLRTNSYSDGSTAVTIKFWDFKIEEGAYTSYVPSVNQAQYGELGYGSNIIRDATGREHDGIVVVSDYAAGSPRFSTAMVFSTTNANHIWPIRDPITADTEEYSISVWFTSTNIGATQFIWCGRTSGGKACSVILESGKLRIDDDNMTVVTPSTALTSNTWYHVVVTWKKGGNKITYVNGIVASTVAVSSTLSKSNTYASIGTYSAADSYTTSYQFQGMLSDFRIYGTALTADDIKELYATGAAIDNTGIVHAGSFEEIEPKARAEKTTMFFNSGVTESGGTSCVTLVNSTQEFNPNYTKWSYTPVADTDNSCMDFATFNVLDGVSTYHISMIVEWSGFDDITTTNPSFGTNFHGILRGRDGTNSWNTNPVTTALNGISNWNNMVRGAASGVYKYEATITLTSSFIETYKGCDVGFRTNYSNGTGKITASKLRIYPADEHCDGMASITSSGGIRSRLLEEAEFE